MRQAIDDTICAISSPPGTGGIALIRLSGNAAFEIAQKVFQGREGLLISALKSHTLHYGRIYHQGSEIDDVLLSVFRAPHSYTGEDSIEITCHGSVYIQQKVLEALLQAGARLAEPGEYTRRAFLNGRMDLTQAEAVADLIASQNAAAHRIALNQMRGGFSSRIQSLRQQLLDLGSLLELELDFAEEDVEFAGRDRLALLITDIRIELGQLIDSFKQGNLLKNGIPVAIIGKPNVGKSTLLNALINEERAIVSEIPGTTRDSIEEVVNLRGIAFRFIDTAGLRQSVDVIENLGIERTYAKIRQAAIVLYVFDISRDEPDDVKRELMDFGEQMKDSARKFIVIGNKTDELVEAPHHFGELSGLHTLFISARRKENLHLITDALMTHAQELLGDESTVLVSVRHQQALQHAAEAVLRVGQALEAGISSELISSELRIALYHLGLISGEISNEEILGNIFQNFCIGK
jgi:tRNA modification GTPase